MRRWFGSEAKGGGASSDLLDRLVRGGKERQFTVLVLYVLSGGWLRTIPTYASHSILKGRSEGR